MATTKDGESSAEAPSKDIEAQATGPAEVDPPDEEDASAVTGAIGRVMLGFELPRALADISRMTQALEPLSGMGLLADTTRLSGLHRDVTTSLGQAAVLADSFSGVSMIADAASLSGLHAGLSSSFGGTAALADTLSGASVLSDVARLSGLHSDVTGTLGQAGALADLLSGASVLSDVARLSGLHSDVAGTLGQAAALYEASSIGLGFGITGAVARLFDTAGELQRSIANHAGILGMYVGAVGGGAGLSMSAPYAAPTTLVELMGGSQAFLSLSQIGELHGAIRTIEDMGADDIGSRSWLGQMARLAANLEPVRDFVALASDTERALENLDTSSDRSVSPQPEIQALLEQLQDLDATNQSLTAQCVAARSELGIVMEKMLAASTSPATTDQLTPRRAVVGAAWAGCVLWILISFASAAAAFRDGSGEDARRWMATGFEALFALSVLLDQTKEPPKSGS